MSPEHSVPSETHGSYGCNNTNCAKWGIAILYLYYIVTIYDSTLRAWDLIYSPSINCSLSQWKDRKSTPLSGGTLVWTCEANKASGEAGPPLRYFGNNGHHIPSDSVKYGLPELVVLTSGSRPSCSPEYCLLILRLPTALHWVGHVTTAICNECSYPCASRLLQSPKLALCCIPTHFQR